MERIKLRCGTRPGYKYADALRSSGPRRRAQRHHFSAHCLPARTSHRVGEQLPTSFRVCSCTVESKFVRSPSNRQSSTGVSESRPGCRRQSRRWLFLRFGFRRVKQRSIFPELSWPVILKWLAASTLRRTSRQAPELRASRWHRQAALSCLNFCPGPSLFLSDLGQAPTVAQPLRPIAVVATDPLPDKLRPHLPKPWELTPARCLILSAVPSSKEQFARKSADRCCPNKRAACS